METNLLFGRNTIYYLAIPLTIIIMRLLVYRGKVYIAISKCFSLLTQKQGIYTFTFT